MSEKKPVGSAGPHQAVRSAAETDGMLAEWGTRLFYPIPRGKGQPSDSKVPMKVMAALMTPKDVRAQIRSTVAAGATQVMVKITGGGRGMKAISAHFRYISRLGKDEVGGKGETLEVEDERGEKIHGKDGLQALAEDWRMSGRYIDDASDRREAFNIIFSMPAGTPPEAVREATAVTARTLFAGHKYVFVLHEDQRAPHVHLVVRAERADLVRLSPRKADLEHWRAVFARELQGRGVNAVATRQVQRAANRNYPKIWEKKAAARGALIRQRPGQRTSAKALAARVEAIRAWEKVAEALAGSKRPDDVRLAVEAMRFLAESAPGGREAARIAADRAAELEVSRRANGPGQVKPQRDRSGSRGR